MTRGERNNNPGNIRVNDRFKWRGQSEDQIDSDFVTFTNAYFGIRALCRVLITYYDDHNLDTIQGIINRWAPSAENDVDAYVADVSRRIGVGADDPILLDEHMLCDLARSIIKHENGRCIYLDTAIKSAAQAAMDAAA